MLATDFGLSTLVEVALNGAFDTARNDSCPSLGLRQGVRGRILAIGPHQHPSVQIGFPKVVNPVHHVEPPLVILVNAMHS
jgi:hypothetical protein